MNYELAMVNELQLLLCGLMFQPPSWFLFKFGMIVVPSFTKNIVFVTYLIRLGFHLTFSNNCCFIMFFMVVVH